MHEINVLVTLPVDEAGEETPVAYAGGSSRCRLPRRKGIHSS
jgi:hypothetical protein